MPPPQVPLPYHADLEAAARRTIGDEHAHSARSRPERCAAVFGRSRHKISAPDNPLLLERRRRSERRPRSAAFGSATRLGRHSPFDVAPIRRDFPILDEHVNGRPLVWLDNAATTQKPQGGHRSPLVLLRARELEHPPRRAHARRARDRRLRGRAREGATLPQRAARSSEIVFVARHDRGHQPDRADAGAGATSARATRSSSRSSSTTPTSFPGSSSARSKGAKLRVAPVDDRGAGPARGVRAAPRAADQARRVHAGVERARHDHAGADDDRDGASLRRARARRRRAVGLAHAGRRAGTSTATSSCSPATRSSRRPASASSTARRSCSTACRPGKAAAT